MTEIKFSKEYCKLHHQTSAELLAVRRLDINADNPFTELLDYDTLATDGTRYEIKKGHWLQLVFLGDKGIPFCTIRSDRPAYNGMKSKYDYYNEKVGERFVIVRTFEASTSEEKI